MTKRLLPFVSADGQATPRAFAALARCTRRILVHLNGRIGRPLNDHDLEDVAQDVAVLAWQRLPAGLDRERIDGWVYTTCFHVLMNRIRRHGRRPVRSTLPDEVGSEGGDRDTADLERLEEVERALDILDDDERDVVERRVYDDATFDEIGRASGCPSSTVKARYYRARMKLQEYFEGRGLVGGERP